MSERKWTQGPWFADEAFVWAEKDELLFDASDMEDQVEAFATARLISAAPELYEALEIAISYVTDCGNDLVFCDRALAKAKGEIC